MKLEGILPPVPTPFVNDELAIDKLKENLQKWNKTKLSGYLILGSNGEAVMLHENERRTVIEAARSVIPSGKIMMVGAGTESTRETIRMVRMAADGGADCALVITPSFFKSAVTQEAMFFHYTSVADASKIPILLYSVPQFTGVSLQASTVARLAEHPNIIGMKDSSGDMTLFADLVAFTPKKFTMFVGSAPVLLPALSLGAAGGILAVANVIPEPCVRLFELLGESRINQARQIQFNINPLSHAVTSKYGVAGLKAAMELAGYFGGEPRRPLIKVNDQVKMELHGLLQLAMS